MIVISKPPAESSPPAIRIDRIITVDANGDERWWDLDDLLREHPNLLRQYA